MRWCLSTALALALAAPLGATAPGAKPKVQPAPLPAPYAGVYQPHGVDEIGLWHEDDEQERALANSPLLIRDEALNSYVRGILCRDIGADRCGAVRLYILRVPIFNASMSPNGSMRIFSGLLLRTRSEAELAAVLGHEFGHFEKRHSLAGFKRERSATDFLSWAAVMASMSAQGARSFQNLQLSVEGGFYRYKRDQEREADLLGLGYLNHSTLRASAASRVWRNLILEQEASSGARGLKSPISSIMRFSRRIPSRANAPNIFMPWQRRTMTAATTAVSAMRRQWHAGFRCSLTIRSSSTTLAPATSLSIISPSRGGPRRCGARAGTCIEAVAGSAI